MENKQQKKTLNTSSQVNDKLFIYHFSHYTQIDYANEIAYHSIKCTV